jgi:ferrous iron transport protein B
MALHALQCPDRQSQLKQKVGNYPGVTVEKKIGTVYSQHGQPMQVIDLPGAYSLAARSPDEAVTRDVLLGRRSDTAQPDRILCIVDATNLERNLYLVHQILDLGRPVILVLNMMDLATQAGLQIRVADLEQGARHPGHPLRGGARPGTDRVEGGDEPPDLPLPRHRWDIPSPIAPAVSELQASLVENDRKAPLSRAGRGAPAADGPGHHPRGRFDAVEHPHHRDSSLLAETLGGRRHRLGGHARQLPLRRHHAARARTWWSATTARRTRVRPASVSMAVVTHPVWGWLVLGGIMALLFLSIFTLAEYPMNWIDGHIASLADLGERVDVPGDLRDLITDGAIGGVGGVLVFLPQILILFFFIGLLESTGYMARAAFIMDRLMSRVG